MKRLIYSVIVWVILILLTGCTRQSSSVPINYRWANVEGSQFNETLAGEQFYFNILVDQGIIDEGAPIKIQVSGQINSGSLHFELRRPDGQAVWTSETFSSRSYSTNTAYTLPAGQTGTYTLGIVYDANTSATYKLGWHALKLGPSILVPGLGMIFVSLAFIVYASRRGLLGWRYLGMGALFWVLTVFAKFAFAIPVNPVVMRLLNVSYTDIFLPANLVIYLYMGALTGIFEVGLAWLILRKIRWGKAAWNQALVFGIGFGMVEALLLGLIALSSALVGLLAPQSLPVSALGGMANNANLLMGLAPVVERLAVIFAHIFSCVLIFYAIATREAKWAWISILYKTLLDTPAGFAAFWGTGTPGKLWAIEAVLIVFGLIALWGILQIAWRYPQEPVESSAPEAEPMPQTV